MVFLLLAILCSVSVAMLFTYASRYRIPTFALFAVNYVVAAGVSIAGSGESIHILAEYELLALGVVLGILFVTCFWLFMQTVHTLGMVIPVTLMRLSAVLPTAGSIVFFAEIPTAAQLGGIALAFLALPLASREPITRASLRPLLRDGLGWGLILFFAYGATDFLFKIQKEFLPVANPSDFLQVVFTTAMIITIVAACREGARLTPRVLIVGVLLGVVNMLSAWFFILALRELPGMVVFPINGIGIIVLSAIAGMLIWRERLVPRNYLYLACAAIALLLIA
ncbi:MAG: hypothetical protein KFH87_09095 [Bacteroidetes bacterium]|nr:hypothetical protein [Bacteroidota bacterium]